MLLDRILNWRAFPVILSLVIVLLVPWSQRAVWGSATGKVNATPTLAEQALYRAGLERQLRSMVQKDGAKGRMLFAVELLDRFTPNPKDRVKNLIALHMALEIAIKERRPGFALNICRVEGNYYHLDQYKAGLSVASKCILWKPMPLSLALHLADQIGLQVQFAKMDGRIMKMAKFAELTRQLAASTGFPQVRQFADAQAKWVAAIKPRYERYQAALRVLRTHPHSPAANECVAYFMLAVGHPNCYSVIARYLGQSSDPVDQQIGKLLPQVHYPAGSRGDAAVRLVDLWTREARRCKSSADVYMARMEAICFGPTNFAVVDKVIIKELAGGHRREAKELLAACIKTAEIRGDLTPAAAVTKVACWRKALHSLSNPRFTIAQVEAEVAAATHAKPLKGMGWSAYPACIRQVTGFHSRVMDLAFSSDGKLIACGTRSGRIWVCQTATGKPVHIWHAQQLAVEALAFSADGKWLAGAGLGGTVTLWAVKTGKLVQILQTGGAQSLLFSKDSRRLFMGDRNGVVQMWSVPGGRDLARASGPDDCLFTLCYGPGNKHLYSGSCRSVLRWSPTASTLPPPHLLAILPGATNFIRPVASGKFIVQDGWQVLRLLDTHTGISEIRQMVPAGIGATCALNSKWLYVCDCNATVHLVRASTLLPTTVEFQSPGFADTAGVPMALAPGGQYLAVGGGTLGSVPGHGWGMVNIWKLPSHWGKDAGAVHVRGMRRGLDNIEQLAKDSDLPAQIWLGSYAMRHHDYTDAFRWLAPAADTLDGTAQEMLGRLYWHGWGVVRNIPLALCCFRLASKSRNVTASRYLAQAYARGIGVKPDPAKAIYWWRKVNIEAGYFRNAHVVPFAKYLLHPPTTERNENWAVRILDLAAWRGSTSAALLLGNMCWRGQILRSNRRKAAQYFSLLAATGNAQAADDLARVWLRGFKRVFPSSTGEIQQARGPNTVAAIYWFRRAALEGNADAARRLSKLYASGLGHHDDKAAALHWARVAARLKGSVGNKGKHWPTPE